MNGSNRQTRNRAGCETTAIFLQAFTTGVPIAFRAKIKGRGFPAYIALAIITVLLRHDFELVRVSGVIYIQAK